MKKYFVLLMLLLFPTILHAKWIASTTESIGTGGSITLND